MGHTILAIDDSPTLRKFITKHLGAHSSSYEIITAADGTEGLALAKERRPSVILLDFILPDMNGEDVCNKLKEDESTSGIPIILMSSSAPDITRTEAKFDIVKRSLVKPFSPQLLCTAVGFVLKQDTTAPLEAPAAADKPHPKSASPSNTAPSAPSSGLIRLKGNSSYFSLIAALRGISEKTYTGILRFQHPQILMEVYFKQGAFMLATSRDCDAYFKDAPIAVSDEEKPLLEELKKKQSETGQPVFLQMAERQLLPPENAEQMTLQYGAFMFALAWTAIDSDFEFEELSSMPDFLKARSPLFNRSDDFALETLRLVGSECMTAVQWGPPTGVPAYTRAGYERVQQLSLNEEEVAFANQVVVGGQTLEAITAAAGMDNETAHRVLFRFLALEIFDYWTATS
jgi:CheY-like chemotaxis protein